MIKKWGSANWKGAIKEGGGTVSTQTGVLREAGYGFNARFEEGPGTNPEELIGAAHAACFAMALSGNLNRAGLTADNIDAKTTISLEKEGDGFTITKAHVVVTAKVPGATEAQFAEVAEATKKGCPVSKVLNAEVTMEATLEG